MDYSWLRAAKVGIVRSKKKPPVFIGTWGWFLSKGLDLVLTQVMKMVITR
jgi:hypothetical protein